MVFLWRLIMNEFLVGVDWSQSHYDVAILLSLAHVSKPHNLRHE
jgi:hypothetical protein